MQTRLFGMVPNNKMLIQTDSPYLSPEPLRGRRNDPRNVKYIAQKIAEVKEITLEEVANITYENTKNIFQIKQKKTYNVFFYYFYYLTNIFQ